MAHECIIAFIPATLKFYLPVGLLCAAFWGITVVVLLVMAQEWRGVGVVGILTTTRLINAVLIRRQSGNKVWSGAVEPNVMGDIFVLLSQEARGSDRLESWITGLTTYMVYLIAALATNIEQFGKILLLCQLVGSAGLLAIANTATDKLHMYMHGYLTVEVLGHKHYRRRLDLVTELTQGKAEATGL
ncbi:hypothetical protein BDV29DRAFT_162962 [Aspergillus leporis]|uniref:Uncharacterized protein n=1 Tax=Aspergillus leporis TaxID=41062 RepID=A0A5N5WHA7_9EURO|nr:hypothetical protein BDV29DRAFT_162962 [Aspergillus leporis]